MTVMATVVIQDVAIAREGTDVDEGVPAQRIQGRVTIRNQESQQYLRDLRHPGVREDADH